MLYIPSVTCMRGYIQQQQELGLCYHNIRIDEKKEMKRKILSLEDPGIDPGTSRMLSERSTI